MPLRLDNVLGIHEAALRLRARRTEILASNLANADTPNYKARDIDFKVAMQQAVTGQSNNALMTTHKQHISIAAESDFDGNVKFRLPTQPALDGNTVETHVEQAAFARNAVEYQATLRFLEGRSQAIVNALKGES